LGRARPLFGPYGPKRPVGGGNGEEMPSQFSDASDTYEYNNILPTYKRNTRTKDAHANKDEQRLIFSKQTGF